MNWINTAPSELAAQLYCRTESDCKEFIRALAIDPEHATEIFMNECYHDLLHGLWAMTMAMHLEQEATP
jgi:hypothetical protein